MRCLVTFGSKHGSTAEIAERIGATLRDQGHAADVVPAGTAQADEYDAVVLGSAVYMARWRRNARAFLRKSRRQLAERPTWLFSSGPVGERKPDEERWTTPKLVRRMAPKVHAREHVVFGGRVPLEPKNFVERAMARDTPPDKRDLRDWTDIEAWAKRIAHELDRHDADSGRV